ncbi:MAG: transaldolase [Deltaproteobacteria bacterium]|nr:transaldolase [Deltaproteobacteria bacterium]
MGILFWYDNLSREIIQNGVLQNFVEKGITGVTTNPIIFRNAVSGSETYDDVIKKYNDCSAEGVCWRLMVDDVRDACDILKNNYESSNFQTGYVSIELNPFYANSFEESVNQARSLWKEINRQNLMIKVPATEAGYRIIRKLISEGINVNVTLIFSLSSYLKACESYLLGLEDMLEKGGDISQVRSVASFFVSRVDVLANQRVKAASISSQFENKLGIWNCMLAYHLYKRIFGSSRFTKLLKSGAKTQTLLWASTGVKDPALEADLYLTALSFEDTAFTLPDQTLKRALETDWLTNYRIAELTDEETLRRYFDEFDSSGFTFEYLSYELLCQGLVLFETAFLDLLKSIESKF